MAEIDVLGYVVASEDEWIYKWFGYDCASPRGMRNALAAANGEDVTIRINSYGGLTWAASEIYTELRKYSGRVDVEIVGLAASAAGVIALAGNTVRMAPTAEFMMHNPWSQAEGDYRDMEHAGQSLRECRETIINAFELRCKNLSRTEIGAMLNRETWLGAKKAIEAGIADEMLFSDATLEGEDEPEIVEADEASSGSGARAAAIKMPNARLLQAQKNVWDAIAPGSDGIEAAKATLAAMRVAPKSEDSPAPESESEADMKASEDQLNRLKNQIGVLNAY